MPSVQSGYNETRSDGSHIGKKIRELVRLMLTEGMPFYKAADQLGIPRQRARRALDKAHVIAYRRQEKAKLVEELSMRVPHKLNELMDSENAAAAVRASLALEDMAQQSRGEPSRRINTGGIVILLGGGQPALSTPATQVIEQIARRPDAIEADSGDV